MRRVDLRRVDPKWASPGTDEETEAWRGESQAQNPPLQTAGHGSSFCFMAGVSPPKHWLASAQRGAGTGPRSHRNPGCLPVVLTAWRMTPPQESRRGRGAPSGAAKEVQLPFRVASRSFGRFQQGVRGAPGAFISFQEGTVLGDLSLHATAPAVLRRPHPHPPGWNYDLCFSRREIREVITCL